MARPVTREDVEAVFDDFAPRVVKCFEDDGEAHPMLFYITLGEERGSIEEFAAMHPAQLHMLMSGEAGKDMLGIFIRDALKPGSSMREQMHAQGVRLPDIVVQISEGWTAVSTAENREEFEELSRKHKGVSTRPDRKEGIFLLIHQHGHSDLGWCPILENPRRAEIGSLISPPDAGSAGRFSTENHNDEDPTCH